LFASFVGARSSLTVIRRAEKLDLEIVPEGFGGGIELTREI
jgi:hypothetical protein